MSGSPIIQNGKFVGAITHVLVNNPQEGYGVFGDIMLKQMKAVRHAAYQDRKFLMDKLMYEFANHECCITIDPYEAIESLGISKDDYLYDTLKEVAPKAWRKYLKSHNLSAFYAPLNL